MLLISAYAARSHCSWHEALIEGLDDFDWQVLRMPPRHFSWRIRGGALSLLRPEHAELLKASYDLVVVTSMLDLASARSLHGALRNTPCMLYFHENQFAYPSALEGLEDIQLLTLKSALAADCVAFNSAFNQHSFLSGCDALMARMPDLMPPSLAASLGPKALVLPVPLRQDVFKAASQRDLGAEPAEPLRIVWNHRWEYDKGPERLARLVAMSSNLALPVEFHILGQQYRQQPPAFQALAKAHPEMIKHFGEIKSRRDYLGALDRADVVLSTALHDFQGLAVAEAGARGCRPLVPDRLAYPEQYDSCYRYASHIDDETAEAHAACAAIAELARQKLRGEFQPYRLTAATNHECLEDYRQCFEELLGKTV